MTKQGKAAAAETMDKPCPSLSELCSAAADHVARARIALGDDSLDADRALTHLDDAIACLKSLWAHDRARQIARQPSLRSA